MESKFPWCLIDHGLTLALSSAALNHGIRIYKISFQTQNQLAQMDGRSSMSTILSSLCYETFMAASPLGFKLYTGMSEAGRQVGHMPPPPEFGPALTACPLDFQTLQHP